ncbi:MAG: tetratricopeptide repeat protein [Victivallales bacterium]|nr:tetratricopeptide repeat protein [Victivallales bacterium]
MKRYAVLLLLVALHLSFSAFAAETARSEWMRGYVKMESGDRNAATKPNEALGQYREALEIFERVRRKYPTWNESLLNYRIKYCKEQIEKLGKNAGQASSGMQKDDLVNLTKEQFATITKLNDERKSLQSRVEVLTESLEKARAESARNAGVETSLMETSRANNELKEKLRMMELQLREAKKEVDRLKAQEGVAEELRKAQAELKLTAAQLQKTQETLTQTRVENENMTRQARQQKLSIDSLTRERNDQDMAMKVVRELSNARKKENEVLQARYETLNKRVEDLTAALEQKDNELKRASDRIKGAMEEVDELRALRTAEAEKMHKTQMAELTSLKDSLNQLLASSGGKESGGDAAMQRVMLENLSRQMVAKDQELGKLAQVMAALFADRERMMVLEEEMADGKKKLVDMTADRDRQRAQVLTCQEDLMTLKGDYERVKGQLTAAENQCRNLLAELDETKRGAQARVKEKGIAIKEVEDTQNRLKTAEDKIQTMNKRLEEQLKVAQRQEREATQLRNELEKLRTDNASLKERNDEERKKLLDATAKAGIEYEKLESLTRQKEIVDKRMKEQEAELTQLRGKLADVEGRLQARQEALETLKVELAKVSSSEAELRKREAKLMAENAIAHRNDAEKLERLETQLKEKSGASLQKEDALKALQDKFDKQNDALAKSEQNNRQQSAAIAEMKTEITRLKSSVETMTGELKDAAATRKTLENQLNEANATVKGLEKTKGELMDKVSAVDGMTRVVAESMENQKKLEADIKKLRQQVTVYEGQLRESDIRARTLKKQLEEAVKGGSSALVGQIKQLTEQRDAAEKRIKALEDVLSDADGKDVKGTRNESSTAKENEALTKMNEALTRQNQLLKTQNKEQLERIAEADKKIRELQKGNQKETADGKQNYVENTKMLEAKIASLNSALEIMTSELELERSRKGGAADGQVMAETASEAEIRRERERREREKQALLKGFIRQGLDAERQGKTEAARWNYSKVLSLQSDNKTALQRMGQLAYQQGDDVNAVRYLKQAFYHDPDDPQTLFALGYSYARQSQADWAVATMGRAVALNPDNASMARVYGATLVQLGWNDAAEREFRRALKLDPKEKNAAFNLAVLLLNSASQSGHGLTTKTVAKMRENSKDWLKNTADKDKVNMVSAILDWLDYLARQADSRTSEAKKWYQVAKENGLDPDPALEKVLK